MALRSSREVFSLNNDFITLNTSERGGILSVGSASGITILEYAVDPSGKVPLGLQYNDVEFLDRSREFDPQRLRETEVPFGIVGAATNGIFETNWLHRVGTICPGDKAYMGPSGTFTNDASLSGFQVGVFVGQVSNNPGLVLFKGGGFHRELIDTATKRPIFVNNPADRVFIVTPGFVKIRVDEHLMIQDRARLP